MVYKFTDEQIKAMTILLDNIETHGIENAKRIVMIKSIIDQGEKEKDNGSYD